MTKTIGIDDYDIHSVETYDEQKYRGICMTDTSNIYKFGSRMYYINIINFFFKMINENQGETFTLA